MRLRSWSSMPCLGVALTLAACQVSPQDLEKLALAAGAAQGAGPAGATAPSPSAAPGSPATAGTPGGGSSGQGSPSAAGTLTVPPDSQGPAAAFSIPATARLEGRLLDGPNRMFTTVKVQVPEGPDGQWTVTTESKGGNLTYRLLDAEKVEVEAHYVDMGQGKGSHSFSLAGGRSYYFQWSGITQARNFNAECVFEGKPDPLESESLEQAKPLKLDETIQVQLFQGHSRAQGMGKDLDFFVVEVPPQAAKLRLKVDNPDTGATIRIKTYKPNAAGSPTHWGSHYGANAGANLNAVMDSPKTTKIWLEVGISQTRNGTQSFPLTLSAE